MFAPARFPALALPEDVGGMLLDDQDAWKIGPLNDKGDGIAGLHNVSLSHANPITSPSDC